MPSLPCVVLAACLIIMVALGGPARGAPSDPSESVFPLVTVAQEAPGQYTGVARGTAFFISPDGAALTNASVVSRALAGPGGTLLLAIVGGESYAARIVCATTLPYDPADPHPFGVPWTRDLAEIALTRLAVPSDLRRVTLPEGSVLTVPPGHHGALPMLHPLVLGSDPGRNERVHVIWVDRLQPLPVTSETSGMVEATSATSGFFQSIDFTSIFSVALASEAAPANSGAPILDDHNEVVGIWTWYSVRSAARGIAIGSSALTRICR